MTSLEIRNSLALLKLDALRGFSIVSQRVKLKGTILQISMYQTVLNHIKIGELVIDGIYKDSRMPKSNTEEMIGKFQEQNNITKDGIPGRQTATKIVEALDRMIVQLPKREESRLPEKSVPKTKASVITPICPNLRVRVSDSWLLRKKEIDLPTLDRFEIVYTKSL